MKRLLVCLLLVGVVGCGETQQVAQQPSGETTQNEQQPNSEQPSGESEQEAQQPNDNIQQEPTPAAKKSVEGREPLHSRGTLRLGPQREFQPRRAAAGLCA